jgi:hypothetical protein
MLKENEFLWGVATSACQLEGSPYADWTSWGLVLNFNPNVTNHYKLYKENLILLFSPHTHNLFVLLFTQQHSFISSYCHVIHDFKTRYSSDGYGFVKISL